jgi:hypothetical protein
MRPFVQIEAYLKNNGDQTEQLISEIKKYNIQDAIVKIIYHPAEGAKDTVNVRAIHNACSLALHLIGIIPIRTHAHRQTRLAMKIDMDLAMVLDAYFEHNTTFRHRKQQLIEQTLTLFEELKASENEATE